MAYALAFTNKAQKQLEKLPRDVRARIRANLSKLKSDPRGAGLKLTDDVGWRLRVGNYRVKYFIEDSDKVVSIYWIGLREDAYKDLG